MFGICVVRLADIVPTCMEWYFKISHLYIIHIPEGYFIRPVQTDVVVHEEVPSHSASHYKTRWASIQDILPDLMASDEIANDSCVCKQLEATEELTRTLSFVRIRGGSGSGS
jgi:hypothetical protein